MANETKIDEVVNLIAQRIVEGTYPTGERLPAERYLVEAYHVSRQTIRSALNRLQTEGLVDISPSSGTYVRFPRSRTTIGPLVPVHMKQQRSIGLANALKSQVHDTQTRFLEPPEIVPAQGAPGLKMNVEVGTQLLHRSRLCLMNQVPYRIVESYYPVDLLPAEVLEDDSARRIANPLQWLPTSSTAEQTHADAYERITCRMPDTREAEILNLNRNQPIIELERWIFVQDDRVFEYRRVITNAALHEFTYTYDAANWDDLVGKSLRDS